MVFIHTQKSGPNTTNFVYDGHRSRTRYIKILANLHQSQVAVFIGLEGQGVIILDKTGLQGRMCYGLSVAFWDDLNGWYADQARTFQEIPFVCRAFGGNLTRPEYIRFLKDYYHFVRSAGPVYSACAARIDYGHARVRDWFAKCAFKEIDHDRFVMNDLKALGIPEAETRTSWPDTAMDALCCYNFGFIERHHPVGLLGTPFLMGKLSVVYSLEASEKIKKALGLKDAGASFFEAHGHLDREQPEDVGLVIQSIGEADIQAEIFLNAKTLFALYVGFLRSLSA